MHLPYLAPSPIISRNINKEGCQHVTVSQNVARALFLHGKAVGVLRKYGKWPYPTYETCWFFSLGTTTTATTKDKGDIQQSKRRGRVNLQGWGIWQGQGGYNNEKDQDEENNEDEGYCKATELGFWRWWWYVWMPGGMPPDTPLLVTSRALWWRHGPIRFRKVFGEWAGKHFWRWTVKVWPLPGPNPPKFHL